MTVRRLLYRIVERLRDPDSPLSRNRHFATFQQPEGREALRIHRHMRSLERDILAAGLPERVQVSDCPHTGRIRVEVSLPQTRTSRTAYLTREEFAMLLRAPEVGALLRQASGTAGAAGN